MYGHVHELKREVASITFASIADVVLSISLFLKSDTFYEANPIANWILQQFGFFGLVVHKIIWVFVAFTILVSISDVKIARKAFIAAITITGTVVVYSLLLLIFVE